MSWVLYDLFSFNRQVHLTSRSHSPYMLDNTELTVIHTSTQFWVLTHCNSYTTPFISAVYRWETLVEHLQFLTATRKYVRPAKRVIQTASQNKFSVQFQKQKQFKVSIFFMKNITISNAQLEACSSVVVKALCYKLEGRGFETQWGEFLNLFNPSGRSRTWGLLSL
jgi:hypothetical protein